MKLQSILENNKDQTWLSWTSVMVVAMLFLFIVVLGLTTLDRLRRTSELMQESLALRGNLLVEYLESATRASLRGSGARVVLLADLAQEMSYYAQLRSFVIVDEQGRVLVSLRNDDEHKPAVITSYREGEQWKALLDGQSFTLMTGNNLVLGRSFQPFVSGRPVPLPHQSGPISPFRFNHSGDYPRQLGFNPPYSERRQRLSPHNEQEFYKPLDPATQTWENMARLCLAVSRGSGRLFAIVELSSQELNQQSKRDLHSALLLAGIIFVGCALLVFAITWFINYRSREVQNMRNSMAENQHMAAVGRLAASVAHEVRNPLSSLRGLVQLMAKNFTPESKESNYAHVAVDEVDRLERVVSGLLNYSRPRTPRLLDLDPGESIIAILEFIKDDPRAKGIGIHCDLPEELPLLPADPDLLRQVLLNLIINALEALNGNGNLWISAEPEGEYLLIQIKDDGPGLPEGKDVFDPFFSNKPQGSGLGLAIAKNIIQAHKGEIKGYNDPEGGAIMEIKLRLK